MVRNGIMHTIPIFRNPGSKKKLADIFIKNIRKGSIRHSDRLFEVHFLGHQPTLEDEHDIFRLKGCTVIANVRNPLGYHLKPDREFIQVTKNEGNLFSLLYIAPKEDRFHTYAFFKSGINEFLVVAPKDVAVSRSHIKGELEPYVYGQDGGTLEDNGSGSLHFFENRSIVAFDNIYKWEIEKKAAIAIEGVIRPMRKELAKFAEGVGIGWIAQRIRELPPG
jgi:hypothetical protein